MTDIIQEKLEKDIKRIREGCGKDIQKEHNLDSDLDCGEDIENENSESGASFLLCNGCLRELYIKEAKLKQHKKTVALIRLEFRHAYNKCKQGLEEIRKQKPRENNKPRDWEQRMDEIALIYSTIFNLSVNEARGTLGCKSIPSDISSKTKEEKDVR